MIIIGLCGSSGAGKGYVCSAFKEYGIDSIDTDKVYVDRIVSPNSPCLNELRMFFGREIINPDGSLNKKKLSERVFEGSNAGQHLKVLNTITHRYIRTDVENTFKELREKGTKAIIVDAPVFFESGFDDMCSVTICVTSPDTLKLERIMKRDKISYEKALARIQSQLPDERLRELCDYEIINDGKVDIDTQVKEIIEKINFDGE